MANIQFKTPEEAESERLEEAKNKARRERNEKLRESDVEVLRALESGKPVPKNLKDYRQSLRDLPEQAGFPKSVSWPNKPNL
ncbi:hypothetical protein GCM10007160_18410 [Litchfieldella qijiaojingensis]|uniref:Phage tail assembly chaperone-like domain-containing protein n=1 Tax=Litchfieldella qijiaojingensis TaxID=980347 RepID=A0ABQ2YPN5_9GAMM|nr:tail fiber assembly protein [Halomonas qijiaojingensis]GGX91229.1 hypothetical protein GCM10007160_18410 [Halomonas qijiaojingensis]